MSISRLPDEILTKIAENLQEFAAAEEARFRRKRAAHSRVSFQAYLLGTRELSSLSYVHDQEPILNTFQSFTVLNRKIYNVCLRLVWKRLSFPTTLPIPITLWTDTILPKHGHLIRTLTMRLPDQCLKSTNMSSREVRPYDNTYILNGKKPLGESETAVDDVYVREDLSRGSMLSLLKQCPNLQRLRITTSQMPSRPEDETLESVNETRAFRSSLTASFSSLANLCHFEWAGMGQKISEDFLAGLISNLPALESFSCSEVSQEDSIENGLSLGYVLSQMRYLTKLQLRSVDSIDSSWALQPWIAPLKFLALEYCENVGFEFAHTFIHLFASTLNQLHLFLDEPSEQLHHNNALEPQNCFTLPALIRLDLEEPSAHPNVSTIFKFRNCHNLLDLVYRSNDYSPDWTSIRIVMSRPMWPSLKFLMVRSPHRVPGHQQADHSELIAFCKSAGIEFVS